MNTSKYGIPVVGALAFSMTGCQDLLSSGADGDWEAIEFNGVELENQYTGGDYISYLSLNMTLSSGEFADATWTATYSVEDMADSVANFSGDYQSTDDGKYDILLKRTDGSGWEEINLICTLSGDDMNCGDVTVKDPNEEETQTSGPAYFVRSGTKTE